MNKRNIVLQYFLKHYFKNDIKEMADYTEYSHSQITKWINNETVPNHETIEYVANCLFTPEFTVIKEFFDFNPDKAILTQLKEMYSGHEHRSGVYAFYDSTASLLYVGKASNLLDETYSAIRREYELLFPAGIQDQTVPRYNLINYISAYDIKQVYFLDYPKHVESLILRISKPRMNKQIGILSSAYPKENE